MDDALTRYLAEEIAEDHAAGRFTRREALKRLGLMGFSAMGASSLLAACGGDGGTSDDDLAIGGSTTSAGGPSRSDPLATVAGREEAITYPGNGVELQGIVVEASSPAGAVMVIHENRGISDFIRAMVNRLADDGFTALAPDLLSRAGGTAAVPESEVPARLQELAGSFTADMRSTLDELERRAPGQKLGMCGFCFGGSQTWRLLEAGEPRLEAAVPCYGTPSDDPSFTGSRQAAVLAIYAEQDDRVNATRPVVEAALRRDSLTHEIRTFPGVGHGFIRLFDQEGVAGHDQAVLGYQAMEAWFRRQLA